jgi:hypothetical protein
MNYGFPVWLNCRILTCQTLEGTHIPASRVSVKMLPLSFLYSVRNKFVIFPTNFSHQWCEFGEILLRLGRRQFQLDSGTNQLGGILQLGFEVFPVVTGFGVIGFFIEHPYHIHDTKPPFGLFIISDNRLSMFPDC